MYEKELESVLNAIDNIKSVILNGYNEEITVEIKDDHSPVTNVDKKVDAMLREYLASRFPTYSFLTEESIDDLTRIGKEFVWIIDPIDGTLEFINHKYDFVTNVALCRNHEIVLAVIYVPLKDEIYFAVKGQGATLLKGSYAKKIHVSNKLDNLTSITSPYHFSVEEKNYIRSHSNKISKIYYGGAAYKACLIARGTADVSYRFSSNSKEWDTAAPQLILEEAGGCVIDKFGNTISYNKKDVRNLNGFMLLNRKENYEKTS